MNIFQKIEQLKYHNNDTKIFVYNLFLVISRGLCDKQILVSISRVKFFTDILNELDSSLKQYK